MNDHRSFTMFKSLSLVSIICLLAGCTTSSDMSPVSGTVKSDGKLLTEGEVAFHPAGGGRPSYGTIQDDGSYQLMTKKLGDGVSPGSYRVTIKAEKRLKPTQTKPANMTPEEELDFIPDPGKLVLSFPEKYSSINTTTLTAEVEAGKTNEINFDSAEFE